tara:strand:+ start:1979 stop:2485 length:507 start_codon:yes stop_codon:yes gene_type:complete
MLNRVFLSLGSNIGDRESNLAQATSALSVNLDIEDIQSSSYYESEPLYNSDQPRFLNSVISFYTNLKPFELLDIVKRIETMLGRPELREKNQPRIIDIDILLHGDSILETDELVIPHPMLGLRKFVLLPFTEIASEFEIPHLNIKIKDLLSNCPDKTTVLKHHMKTQA